MSSTNESGLNSVDCSLATAGFADHGEQRMIRDIRHQQVASEFLKGWMVRRMQPFIKLFHP